MRRSGLPRGSVLAVAWALVGVLGGHVLTYAILFPDAHAHDATLAESGHGWLAMLGPAALTAAAVAVTAGLLGSARRGGSRGVRFATLALFQVGLFTSLELAERIGTGMTIESLPLHLVAHGLASILVLGSLIQLLTAWLGSAASRLVATVAGRLRPAPPRRRRAAPRRIRVLALPPAARPVRAHRSRGPPSLVASAVPTP